MSGICVCCPFLGIMNCGDTKEHKHPTCSATGAMLANDKVSNICVSDNKWQVDCLAYLDTLKEG